MNIGKLLKELNDAIKEVEKLEQENEALKKPLYAFLYNPMIHESGYITVSVHRTREGAKKALEWHRHNEELEYIDACGVLDEWWNDYKLWKIEEIIIQP